MQTETLINSPYGKIYKITNKFNNKSYIGQTTQELEDRLEDYKKIKCKGQPKIYNALKKYGPDNFIYECIDIANNQNILDQLETHHIRQLNSMHNGYNCNEGGAGRGRVCDETRRNMSIAFTGRKLSEQTRQKMSKAQSGKNNPNFGKHHSVETKLKISNARKGQKMSEERRAIFSKAFLGHKHTTESKLKISKSNSGENAVWFGKQFSEEHKRKISEAHKGRITSNEHRMNLSKALKGHKLSEETKRKISESHKKRYINESDL